MAGEGKDEAKKVDEPHRIKIRHWRLCRVFLLGEGHVVQVRQARLEWKLKLMGIKNLRIFFSFPE